MVSRNKTTSRAAAACRHRGLSLLEVLLALTILVTGLAAIVHQADAASRAGIRLQTESTAAVLCRSQLDILLASDVPPDTISERPIPGAPGWLWASRTASTSSDGVLLLQVVVRPEQSHVAAGGYELSRLIDVRSMVQEVDR